MGRVNKSENMCMFCEFVFFSSCDFILYRFFRWLNGTHNMALRCVYGFECNAMRYWHLTIQPPFYAVCMHVCVHVHVFAVALMIPSLCRQLFLVIVVVVVDIVVVSQILSSHQVHFLHSFSFLLYPLPSSFRWFPWHKSNKNKTLSN